MIVLLLLVVVILLGILIYPKVYRIQKYIVAKVKTIGVNMTPIKKILEPSLYERLNRMSKQVYQKKDYRINTSWDKGIKDFSKPVFVHTIQDASIRNEVQANLLRLGIKRPINDVMLYFWIPGSYIPWHKDGIYTAGLTIYLNEFWKVEYGGLFQFTTTSNVVETIVPSGNMGVYQEGGVPHSTTVVAKHAPVRRTLQVFFQ